MTRTEIYKAVHIAGVGLVAALGYVLTNAPEMPHYWRVGIGAIMAALMSSGLYWAKPPGVTIVNSNAPRVEDLLPTPGTAEDDPELMMDPPGTRP